MLRAASQLEKRGLGYECDVVRQTGMCHVLVVSAAADHPDVGGAPDADVGALIAMDRLVPAAVLGVCLIQLSFRRLPRLSGVVLDAPEATPAASADLAQRLDGVVETGVEHAVLPLEGVDMLLEPLDLSLQLPLLRAQAIAAGAHGVVVSARDARVPLHPRREQLALEGTDLLSSAEQLLSDLDRGS